MNAYSMKLENRESSTIPKDKGSISISKKCSKNQRKKVISINVDKDASPIGNGLRCESENTAMENCNRKPNVQSESSTVKKGRSKKICQVDSKMLTKSEKVHDRLQEFLSIEAKEKISIILNDVRTLSDVEKLYLYLQLPTGSTLEIDPLKQKNQNPLGKKADEEGTTAIIWIQSHLEEDPLVSLPKQEVYDEYQSYCQVTGCDPLCAADFGKVMKQIFPSVKPRRLGTRGNSRYCYSGLRKKVKVEAPALPSLQMEKDNGIVELENVDDDVTIAACHLLFEWAEKLLGSKFTSIKDLASHLIQHMYVDNRSVAAFTVLLATSPQLFDKSSPSAAVKSETVSKKSEAQLHLQRKIQEKELIKEQKRKLQDQRSKLTGQGKEKSSSPKKKSAKSMKHSVVLPPELHSDQNLENDRKEGEVCPPKEAVPPDKITIKEESLINGDLQQSTQLCRTNPVICPSSNSSSPRTNDSPGMKISPLQSPGSSSEMEDNIKSKVIIAPRSKTPVCIAQSIPGIIIVPSLSQMQISDLGSKTGLPIPKYKRIQPKPLANNGFSTVVRSRASSFGSSILCKPRRTNDGRRSSHAWLQSESGQESSEELSFKHGCPAKNYSMKVSNTQKTNMKKSSLAFSKDNTHPTEASKHKSVKLNCISEQMSQASATSEILSNVNFLKNDTTSTMINFMSAYEEIPSETMEDPVAILEDYNSVKRHADETEDQISVKRPHLENPQIEPVNNVYSVWVDDICHLANNSSNPIVQNSNSAEQQTLVLSEEEVNLHEIEDDACDDYFQGANAEVSDFSANLLLQEDAPIGKDLELENKQLACNSKVRQLSQLRMLLEKNLPPSGVPKSIRIQNDVPSSAIAMSVMHSNIPPVQVKTTLVSNAKKPSSCETKSLALNSVLNSLINTDRSMSNHWPKSINSNVAQVKSFESLARSKNLVQNAAKENTSFFSNPLMLFNKEKDLQLHNLHLNNAAVNVNLNSQMNERMSGMSALSDGDSASKRPCSIINCNRVSTYTQVPSVPQSPNTRRIAFNFMPISPRHTPIPEAMNTSGTGSSSSPVPNHHPRMISTAAGPSQPPSNSGSPFVSPIPTPVPPCRSRHSSGQSSYSTSRHTPFQNIDSGVSSVSSSPFISPQPTPIPANRLREFSSDGKTVTFCSINNPQVMHSQSIMHPLGQLRSRHSSGPGGLLLGGSITSSKNAPLSPLVNDHCSPTFIFPTNNEVRSRHSSGSTMTPLSPVSEQTSPSSSCASNFPDLLNASDTTPSLSHSFLNDGAGDLLISANPANFKQVRQRHASSSVIYSKPSLSLKDSLSQEVQMLLKNIPQSNADLLVSNRSHSVPLHQMLHNLDSYYLLSQPLDDPSSKSHPTTPLTNETFSFSLLSSNQDAATLSLAEDNLNRDKTLIQSSQMEWSGIESSSDIEMSAARRNLASLLDAPLSDDLQRTLEDLRDCDTDFSKFAQELELGQHEEASL